LSIVNFYLDKRAGNPWVPINPGNRKKHIIKKFTDLLFPWMLRIPCDSTASLKRLQSIYTVIVLTLSLPWELPSHCYAWQVIFCGNKGRGGCGDQISMGMQVRGSEVIYNLVLHVESQVGSFLLQLSLVLKSQLISTSSLSNARQQFGHVRCKWLNSLPWNEYWENCSWVSTMACAM
jgi:hypothetical protein